MKYALITNGTVAQIQPYVDDGFVEVADDVYCGMLADWKEDHWEFKNPPPQPPPPNKYSKLQIVRQLIPMGKLDAFDAFLTASGASPLWYAAEYLDESYPEVQALLPQIPSAIELTQEQVQEILNNAKI